MEFVIPTLRMNFWAGYDLARCYEAIFRTVPLYGLNGCSFSHQETGAPGGGPQVQIVSQDQNVLYHIQNQLVNSAAFMQSQAVPVSQIMIVPQSGVLDGRVSGNMLEPAFGNKESPAVIGWQLAAEFLLRMSGNRRQWFVRPAALSRTDRSFVGNAG